ncbi:MAG: hypothetical protein M3P84_07775 [Chloroflexota bacterium]|nr:hypothetical protein [Chloroflexota bacterium]
MASADDTGKDEGLKRLGGGRWQTRDERFTIEPQSGTWAVVDAEQTDDLGLPLVRGPFGSLRDAKEAIGKARGTDAPASPLEGRPRPGEGKDEVAEAKPRKADPDTPEPAKPEPEPAEPGWLKDLASDERRRATRLIDRLTAAKARDPEGLVRRDLVGDVPAVAGFAVERAIRSLGIDAPPADLAELLADGRDADLGIRWRLVDGEGRPIQIDADTLRGGR